MKLVNHPVVAVLLGLAMLPIAIPVFLFLLIVVTGAMWGKEWYDKFGEWL